MEIVTISNPISLGFWFMFGAMIFGLVFSIISLVAIIALKLLFG